MGRTNGAINKCWRILAKILQEKVVTEIDLLKMLGYDKSALLAINQSYKQFVDCGLPIKRKTLAAKWNRTGCGSRHANHRMVIYYVE